MKLTEKLANLNWHEIGLFAGGLLFGTAGLKILGSDDAKKVYTHTTAAVLRAKDSIMKTADTIRENCNDILADAKDINEQRTATKDDFIDDGFEDENFSDETP